MKKAILAILALGFCIGGCATPEAGRFKSEITNTVIIKKTTVPGVAGQPLVEIRIEVKPDVNADQPTTNAPNIAPVIEGSVIPGIK